MFIHHANFILNYR